MDIDLAAMEPLLDFQPVGPPSRPGLLALTAGGDLVAIDASSGRVEPRCRVAIPPRESESGWRHQPRPRLHASDDGRFAAVVNDYGRLGVVVQVATGRVTMTLDGGDNDADTVPFAACFARHDGKPVLVHRTSWNRLDVSDPGTGTLLTPRGPTHCEVGGDAPEHYLDYYHGSLTLSPDGHHLLDDGWFWHPFGIPCVWSLPAWLTGNVWESEDGPTRAGLTLREWYWDHPTCWLDNHRVALSGVGNRDDQMAAGVTIYDINARDEPGRAILGPSGDLLSDGQRLFSTGPDGLSIWDIDSGLWSGFVADFRPTRHHRPAGLLAEYDPAGARLRVREVTLAE